jgi:hypothetical protein
MHKCYIFSQFIAPTCFGHFWPSSGCAVADYSNSIICGPPHSARTVTRGILNTSTQLFNFLISVVNIQHDCWVLDDIFVNSCVLDKCTYGWITVLCNSAFWWWSKVTGTCRCNELRKKYITCAFCWFSLIIRSVVVCYEALFLGAFATLRKPTISFVVCPIFRPFTWYILARTGQILMKFDIWDFSKPCRKISSLTCDKNNW